MSKNNSAWIDYLRNQITYHRSWVLAALLMGIANIFLSVKLIDLLDRSVNVLVPYNVNNATGPIRVTGLLEEDGAYIGTIGEADIRLMFEWKPNTVLTSYQRILNRMTPALRAKYEVELLAKGEELSKIEKSQAFFPEATNIKGGVVTVSGVLRRWDGSTLEVDQMMSYSFTYRYDGKIPYVDQISEMEIRPRA
jgi:hypothetical protein